MGLTTTTDSPLHALRIERTLLHSSLPPLLFLANPLARTAANRRRIINNTARESRSAKYDLDDAVERWCHGDGEVCRNTPTKIQRLRKANNPARANKMDSKVPWALAGISCLGMLTKQYINVLQLVNASQWLAEGDRAQRRKMGLPRRKTR